MLDLSHQINTGMVLLQFHGYDDLQPEQESPDKENEKRDMGIG